MRIADALLAFLKRQGVDCIFGIPAGTISPVFDALHDVDIKLIVTKNESGAAYSAARYAGSSGRLGVCAGAGGVGVCNMVGGIADAKRCKAPVLVLSGFVHRWQIGKGAIQEQDTARLLEPLTKYSRMVTEPMEVLDELRKAVKIALTPPCGPVFLSIPVDVQASEFTGELPRKIEGYEYAVRRVDNETIRKAVSMIDRHKYGIIIAGRGTRGFSDQISQLSEHLNWPVVTTPGGKGAISSEFRLNLGNYGFASTEMAERYVEKGPATCILAVGTSLGESSTCNFNKSIFDGRELIHIDSDADELGKVFKTDLKIHGDIGDVIPRIIEGTKKSGIIFINTVEETEEEGERIDEVSLKEFFRTVCELMPANTCYLCDVGEYMNFALKYMSLPEGSDFLFNINYGAMGMAVGGAPGACLADPQKRVAVFLGDGCFFMNGMEILTAKEYKMPVVYFIINNAMLGYVEHGHRYLYGRSLEDFRQERLNIAEIAESMGIKSTQIRYRHELGKVKEFVTGLSEPCVVEIVTSGEESAPIVGRLKALKKFRE